MQIEVEFEVFKALTSLRESESDSYNAVIRRLLNLSKAPAGLNPLEELRARGMLPTMSKTLAQTTSKPKPKGLFGASQAQNALPTEESILGLLSQYVGGAWFGPVFFPEGTRFRATYKGQTYLAEIKGGRWVDADGIVRTSPSEAASAISNTNVNGWRFWHAQLPGDPSWRKLDELKP